MGFLTGDVAFHLDAHRTNMSAACYALGLAIGRVLRLLNEAVSAYLRTVVAGIANSAAARSGEQITRRVSAGSPARCPARCSPGVVCPLLAKRDADLQPGYRED